MFVFLLLLNLSRIYLISCITTWTITICLNDVLLINGLSTFTLQPINNVMGRVAAHVDNAISDPITAACYRTRLQIVRDCHCLIKSWMLQWTFTCFFRFSRSPYGCCFYHSWLWWSVGANWWGAAFIRRQLTRELDRSTKSFFISISLAASCSHAKQIIVVKRSQSCIKLILFCNAYFERIRVDFFLLQTLDLA